MNYVGLPTNVSVTFYTRPDFETSLESEALRKTYTAGFWIGLISRTRVHHVGLMLNRDNKTVVLSTSENSRAKFIDEECFHEKGFVKPTHVADLGCMDVSLSLLNQFIKVPYRGHRRDLLFYGLFSRFLFPSLLPKSCSLLTCEMLRMMGYDIEDYIFPRDLDKVLSKQYPIKTWEEYSKEYNLRS